MSNFFSVAYAKTKFIAAHNSVDAECVILLHGLARSYRSMRKLQNFLVDAGYDVVNVGYKSTKYPIEHFVEIILPDILQNYCLNAKRKHFVTHSMGGIIVRYYLQKKSLPNLGRVVMLSPPNQGSEVVDVMGNSIIFNWVNGPAGQQLGTGENSVPKQLGAVKFELGIITGNKSINPILSTMIPGDDDGKVSIENAKVEGMRDFLVLPYSHTFIMKRQRVFENILSFLTTGKFKLPLRPGD